MSTHFKHLFSPLKVGSMTIRNRIVLPPHGTTFAPGLGDPVQRQIDYFAERAKGGVGMIVKTTSVRPKIFDHWGSWGGILPITETGSLNVSTEQRLIPDFSRLASTIHNYDTKILAQLNAAGRQAPAELFGAYQVPLMAPSPLPCPEMRQIPKEMEIEDIQSYVESYAESARNMRAAGLDGVELFAAQGYLLSEFLSPHVNKRTDIYGGTLENRMRFMMEALTAIRKQVNYDFVVGVRLNADDFVPGGVTIDIAIQTALLLAQSGMVDYLNISGMTYLSWPGWISDMTSPEGMFTHLSHEVRNAGSNLPICVVSRIVHPVQAEEILEKGHADMVGMVRALIADPELPNKALRGEMNDIRYCTNSNQSCLMRLIQGRGLFCVHNPAVGHEGKIGNGKLSPAEKKKKVIVVGGGPAGLAASHIASKRGHSVTIYEKESEIGGQNILTAMIASRHSFAEITRWLGQQVTKENVKLHLNTEATVESILAEHPDSVVIATGSIPLRTGYSSHKPDVPKLPGVEQQNVLTVWDVFKRSGDIGKNVVLIDEDPHMSSIFTAEHLADIGKNVEIITPNVHAARDIETSFLPSIYRRILPKGVTITPNTIVTGIAGSTVICCNKYTHESRQIYGIDTVILAMGNHASNELYFALKGRVPEIYAIGDCLTPRKIEDAIVDGERVGRML
jgi:2,4-dienoyl-CoA reductase-like NADH-dependent reductase (Old Yellow Enzyme family)/thioredoxin reductase